MTDHNIIVIGSVTSTVSVINGLLRHQFKTDGILGYEPGNPINVSGFRDLKSISINNNIDYRSFKKINENRHIAWAKKKKPDLIFAVGFSQLLNKNWLRVPKLGCIGFHPTCLPKGRGRAPLAWSVIKERCICATFFLMGEGADDGPIFVQECSRLTRNDDAATAEIKMNGLIDTALNKWLPDLKKGKWNPKEQDEEKATWYGKRSPEDGKINWHENVETIDILIKASTKPHPGAFTFHDNNRITIWNSEIERNLPIRGVVGRVLLFNKIKGYLVQCGKGLLWINNVEDNNNNYKLAVGNKIGIDPELEIQKIWQTLDGLKNENK